MSRRAERRLNRFLCLLRGTEMDKGYKVLANYWIMKMRAVILSAVLLGFIVISLIAGLRYSGYIISDAVGEQNGLDIVSFSDEDSEEGFLLRDESVEKIFFLDVGSAGDTDSSGEIYIRQGPGLSVPGNENSITYRNISENGVVYFYVNISSVGLAANGVPYKDAILDIGYKDNMDETDCTFTDIGSSCRAFVETNLSYGFLEFVPLVGLGGLKDNEWKITSAFLDANDWQTLRAFNGVAQFRLKKPIQLSSHPSLQIDNITLRFVNYTELYNLREADRAARGLVRIDYVETKTIKRADYPNNYVVYKKSLLEKVYQNMIPSSSEIGRNISLFEVAGNYEPASFAVYAFEDLRNVTINVTDLVGNGKIINSGNITINKVEYLDRRWVYAFSSEYGLQPWYLRNVSVFDVVANKSQQVWLNIYIPDNTAPGNYSGTITISGANMLTTVLNLSIEVFSLKLEEPSIVSHTMHDPYTPVGIDVFPPEVALENFATHDVNPLPYFFDPYFFTNGSVVYNSQKQHFDKFKEYGLIGPRIFLFGSGYLYDAWDFYCPGISIFSQKCEAFDNYYVNAMQDFRNFFGQYNTTPVFAAWDEPGLDPERRVGTNYLDRLWREAGFDTWTTYNHYAEKPLKGHFISFESNFNVSPQNAIPSWALTDPKTLAYWNFQTGLGDVSGHGRTLVALGDAHVASEHLDLDGNGDYATPSVPVIIPPKNFSFSFWFYSNQSAIDAGRYKILVKADSWFIFQHNHAWDLLYFTGNDGAQLIGGGAPAERQWHHLVCSVVTNESTMCYIDGINQGLYQSPGTFYQTNVLTLGVNSAETWNGSIDDFLIMNRTLTKNEISDLIISSYLYGIPRETFNLTTTVSRANMPSSISFSIDDAIDPDEPFETKKSIILNGQEIWSAYNLSYEFQVFNVTIPESLLQPTNTIKFVIHNNYSRRENLTVYFMDEFWRKATWVAESGSSKWNYNHVPDPDGIYAPIDPYLTDRSYALFDLNSLQYNLTVAAGDKVGYYTVYPANNPSIIQNRFLHGFYASALNVSDVVVYAYLDTLTPYDDLALYHGYRLGTWGARGQQGYNLVQPSWNAEVHDTLPFEMLREGIEDSKIINTLQKEIEENPGSFVAQDAENYLNGIYANLSKNYYARYFSGNNSQPIETKWDRTDNILYDLSGKSDDYAFFDDARKKMIGYIIRLQTNPTDSTCSGQQDGTSCDGDGISCTKDYCSDGICIHAPDDSNCGGGERCDLIRGCYNPGGGSGGGGGGKTPAPNVQPVNNSVECKPEWRCGNWSVCLFNIQRRTCLDVNKCDARAKPETEKKCGDNQNVSETNGSSGGDSSHLVNLVQQNWLFVILLSGASIIGILILYFLTRRGHAGTRAVLLM